MTREEAIKRLSEIRADYSCFDDDERPKYHALSMAIQALQEPVTPIAKTQQADTLIIAAALRDFAQDSERNISDRERAGELRGQVLAYGASMCQPVTPTVSEDCISRQKAIETCDKMYPQVDRQDIKTVIEATPSVTPTERTGEWTNTGVLTVHCSNCKSEFHELEAMNFCPNCGAKMKGGTENE